MSIAADNRLVTQPAQDEPFEPLLRWLIFTGVSVFAAVALWRYGLVRAMVVSDRTYLSSVIAALYVAASGYCLRRAVAISREAKAVADIGARLRDLAARDLPPRGLVADHIRDLFSVAGGRGASRLDQTLLLRGLAQRLRAPNKLGKLAADSSMKLGLLGTIIGFILMLGPIAGLDADDGAALEAAMGTISEGMAVAMYTTLAGLIGSILLNAQYFMLEAATTNLFWNVVRLTETKILPALERPDV